MNRFATTALVLGAAAWEPGCSRGGIGAEARPGPRQRIALRSVAPDGDYRQRRTGAITR